MKYSILVPIFLATLVTTSTHDAMSSVIYESSISNTGGFTEHFHQSTAFSSTEENTATYMFNDGVGRLVQVDTSYKKGVRELIIRHNMNVVWHTSYDVDSPVFAMNRLQKNGQTSFTLIMGKKRYAITMNEKDKWRVTEIRSQTELEPVTPPKAVAL